MARRRTTTKRTVRRSTPKRPKGIPNPYRRAKVSRPKVRRARVKRAVVRVKKPYKAPTRGVYRRRRTGFKRGGKKYI